MGETKEQKAERLAKKAENTSQEVGKDSAEEVKQSESPLKEGAEALAKAAEDENIINEAEQARIKQEEAEAELKRLADVEHNKVDSISIKGVVLNGTAAQKKGTHTVHLTPSQIVNFVDGKADVKEDVETALKNAGYIE